MDMVHTGLHACTLLGAGSIDVKELHVGLLLVYDKLNKASWLVALLCASMPPCCI